MSAAFTTSFVCPLRNCLSPIKSQKLRFFLTTFFGTAFLTLKLGMPAGLRACFSTVNLPDLGALKTGDANAWDEAFNWLWPTVFAVAKLKLQPYFPNEVEDVAIESIEQLVKKVPEVKSVEELKPLAASIAHNRAVSLLRERFAKKRGEGKTDSLDDPQAGGGLVRTNRRQPIHRWTIWSKRNWRNGSGNPSRNSNRRWVTSFQISFSMVCATTRLPGSTAYPSARWVFT